jgi:hypothetical protein
MIRCIAWSALVLGLAMMPRSAASTHHEPVVQVITVDVAAGKLEAYRAEVKKLAAVLARVDAAAQLRMWETTAGGEDAGQILVSVEYPNEAAWAADATKTRGDAEWQRIVAGLAGVRTVVSTGLWQEITPNPPAGAAAAASANGDEVLVLTGVEVQPGKLESYRTQVGTGRAIIERLGLKSRLRLWRAELAGPSTGAVSVGVLYPDLATYVADQAKLADDPEWQKFLAGLDAVRTVRGRWLYRDITP